jgi:quercetin dioxygenase-like cupin family protein
MDHPHSGPDGFLRQAGAGPTLNVLGVVQVQLAAAADTGGFSLWELAVPPGAGAPPHIHAGEDEALYILDGALEIALDHMPPRRLGPGSFVFAPRGHRHTFRNPGAATARALLLATPGASLDAMFAELAGVPAGAPLDGIVAIAASYGVAVEATI